MVGSLVRELIPNSSTDIEGWYREYREIEASLGYMVSSWPAWATEWDSISRYKNIIHLPQTKQNITGKEVAHLSDTHKSKFDPWHHNNKIQLKTNQQISYSTTKGLALHSNKAKQTMHISYKHIHKRSHTISIHALTYTGQDTVAT